MPIFLYEARPEVIVLLLSHRTQLLLYKLNVAIEQYQINIRIEIDHIV